MNKPHASNSSGSYLPESAETYFRWGIPSLVLAFVTITLATYSVAWVQPNLRSNYRKFCDSQLAFLKIPTDHSNSTETAFELSSISDPLALKRRINDLEKLQLALKRLVFWNKDDANSRHQLAMTSLALHETAFTLAQLLPQDDPDKPRFLAESGNALAAATDAMRAVARLNSEHALNANLWLSNQKLDTSNLTLEQLQELETQLLAWNGDSDPSTYFLSVLCSSQWKQATHPTPQNDSDRIDSIKRCHSFINKAAKPSIALKTLQAKCDIMLAEPKAKQTAQAILDEYGVSISESSIDSEHVSCIYEALLLTGEIVEAQSYLVSWLNNPKWSDRDELLRTLNRSSTELFVMALFANRKDMLEPILAISFRTGMAAPILAFLEKQSRDDSNITTRLGPAIEEWAMGRDSLVRFAILIQRSIRAGQWDTFDKLIATIKNEEDGRNVLAVQIVLVSNELGDLEATNIYRCIETINKQAPLPFEVNLQLLDVLAAKEQIADANHLRDKLRAIQPDHPKLQTP